MRAWVWRIAERYVRSRLTAQQAEPVLGDLAEDFNAELARTGLARASIWLARESRSVVQAYARGAAGRGDSGRLRAAALEARLAARRLRKHPAGTVTSVVTLGLAIGAGAATWSVVSAVMLHPIRVPSPDTLGVVTTQFHVRGGLSRPYAPQPYDRFSSIREAGVFARTAGGGAWSFMTSNAVDAPAERRSIFFVSANYFDVLGVRLPIGPGFRDQDDRRGAAPTAVISDAFWRGPMLGAADIIGRRLVVSGQQVTITGVAPAGFPGTDLTHIPDFYMPIGTIGAVGGPNNNYFADASHPSSPSAWINVIARLKPGQTLEAAAAALNGPSRGENARVITVMPATVAAVPAAVRPTIAQFSRLLGITVALLVLVGGLTVGLFLLIRTEARSDEFAMCLALGASRARLAAGVVIEGTLLAGAGAALGVATAWLLLQGVAVHQLPGGISIGALHLGLDLPLLLAAIACGVGTALVAALVAGAFSLSANLAAAIKSRMGATPRHARRHTRSALVIAQVAVTVALVAGAGLFARSLAAAMRLNAEIAPDRLIDVTLPLAGVGYTPERTSQFAGEMIARLDGDARVAAIAQVQSVGSMNGRLTIDGEARDLPSAVDYTAIDDRYFATVGLPILSGRNFSRDDVATAPLAIIVSASFARFIAPDGRPIGHRVTEISRAPGQPFQQATIVGVVPDVISDVTATEPLSVYYALAQRRPSPNRRLVVRATGDVDGAVADIRSTAAALDAAVTLPPTRTFEENIGRQMAPQRFGALVLSVLGATASLLTVMGAYVLAVSLAQLRLRETGIRAALGATRMSLGRGLLWQSLRPTAIGLGAGAGLVWLGAGTIRAFLFQVQPFDAPTLAAVAGGIVVVTIAASLEPMLAALRVDLVRLLRDE